MPDGYQFKLVDAFASAPFTGNVAGVVLDADDLSDEQMQSIAVEFNASETVFVLRPTHGEAAVRFRWFTPGCEVDFCGHATLAGVHALLEEGRFAHAMDEPGTILPIETRSGTLTVRTERPPGSNAPETIWLDMPHCDPKSTHVVLPPLLDLLGLSGEMTDARLPPIRTHDDDVILAIKALPALLELQPSMGDLARYCRRERIRGILITTTNVLTAATVVQSRFFAPAAGVDEDPVTGSIHGPLGLHLVNSRIVEMIDGLADFHCAQAKAGGRAGLVRVAVIDEGEERRQVRIGGRCATTAAGVLVSLPGG